MALTSHHHVHPVRRTVGLLALVAVVIVLLVLAWGRNDLADNIESSFSGWLERSGRATTP